MPPPRAATLPLRPLSARARASPQNMVSASIAPSCRINAARLLHPQTLGNPPDSTQQKYALEANRNIIRTRHHDFARNRSCCSTAWVFQKTQVLLTLPTPG